MMDEKDIIERIERIKDYELPEATRMADVWAKKVLALQTELETLQGVLTSPPVCMEVRWSQIANENKEKKTKQENK